MSHDSESRATLELPMSHPTIKIVIATALALFVASTAQAGGWYHMPTSFCQCMGWGFGPGYHAPLVIERGGCLKPVAPNPIVRVPVAPFAVGVGCYGCDPCGLSRLPGCEISPMPAETEDPALIEADLQSNTTPIAPIPPIVQEITPAATAQLPPLFAAPPLIVPVR